MAVEEEPDAGIPEWVVTFGDMMSLLLTFFIMLVSMSEMKQDEKFQAVAEALREQVGHDLSAMTLVPGSFRPRNSVTQWNASMGRDKKEDLKNGGQENKSVVGSHEKVQIVRPGEDSSIGGQVYFDELSVELTKENKLALIRIIEQISGKPQKIEIRGHTTRRPVDPNSGYRDVWDLAEARARSVMEFFVSQGIEPRRIRLGNAGAEEPLYDGVDQERLKRNARVQILMWDETIHDLENKNS
ncbi:MAG: flagellar motor protein MotB [Planctomycetota bacterium]